MGKREGKIHIETTIERLRSKASKTNAKLRHEIRRLVLVNYLLGAGWNAEQINALQKSIKVNFWCGIGYSKAVSGALHLTAEQKAMIWSLIHRYTYEKP